MDSTALLKSLQQLLNVHCIALDHVGVCLCELGLVQTNLHSVFLTAKEQWLVTTYICPRKVQSGICRVDTFFCSCHAICTNLKGTAPVPLILAALLSDLIQDP